MLIHFCHEAYRCESSIMPCWRLTVAGEDKSVTDVTENEFVRGWRYVLGAFIGIAGGFASLYFYAAGLFIKPMAETFDWSRSEASIGAVAISVANTIALPIAGRLADKVGVVKVALISSVALAASFVVLGAFTVGLVSFFVLAFLLTALSAGSTPLTYNTVIVQHFTRRRGLALGMVLTGTGVGAVLVPALLTPFIAENGWRAGYFALAAAALPLGLLAAFLLRGSEAAAVARPKAPSWLAICRHPALLSIGTIIFLAATAVLGSTLHLVPMLTDRGMTPAIAGGFASALGFAVIFGRVFTGYLLDRFDAGMVAAALLLLAASGQVLLCNGTAELAFLGAVLLGFGLGTESDLLAYLLGRRFTRESFGSAYGVIFGIHAAGAGVGGFVAGYIYDVTGDYVAWLVLAAAATSLAALIVFKTERGLKPLAA